MPTVELSINGLLHGNVFNFLILFALFVYLFIKFKVVNVLNNAKNKVIELIEKSEEEKLNSEKSLQEIKKDVENLPLEIEKINNDAQKTIEAFRKASDADIEELSQRLENGAQKNIENEIQKVNNSLQQELALKVVTLANEKTLAKLNENSEFHRKFIVEAIDKIEEIEI